MDAATRNRSEVMKFHMGCDPELALISNGLARCAIYRLPEKLDVMENIGEAPAWVYHDGLNMEFGVRPETDIHRLVDNVRWGLVRSMAWAEKFGLSVLIGDGAPIDMSDVSDKPGWDASGCNPTYNPRYGMEPGPAFPDYAEFMATVGTLTGCHCHLSTPELAKMAKNGAGEYHDNLARILAAVIPPMLWRIASELDGDSIEWMVTRWRKLGVGNYRVPKHGFEYKDIGAIALSSPVIFASVFTVVRDIAHILLSGKKTHMLSIAAGVPIGDSNATASDEKLLAKSWDFAYEFICHVREEMKTIREADIERIWDCLNHENDPESAWCVGKFENRYSGPSSLLSGV